MAISVMKKVMFIAEQSNKEILLESLQEMKETEIFPFDDEFFNDNSGLLESSGEDMELTNYHHIKTHEAIEFLDKYVPKLSLLKQLRKKKPVYTLAELDNMVDDTEVMELVSRVEKQRDRLSELDNELKELGEEERFIRKWSALSFDPNSTQDLKYFNVTIGSIDNEDSTEFIDQLKEVSDDNIVINEVFVSEDDNGYILIYAKDYNDVINEVIQSSDFSELEYNFLGKPKDVLAFNLEHRKKYIAEENDIKDKLRKSVDVLTEIQLANEYYGNLLEREKASQFIMNSEYLFILQGWMDEELVANNLANVEYRLGSDSVVHFVYDVHDDEIDNVPTKLKNNAFNEPFELLTKQFAIPKYDEVDPTPFFTVFHVIFFGLMSADAGYGILLFLGTLIPLMFFEMSAGMRKNLKMFNFMSLGTILIGLFFGSFFGFSLPFRVMDLSSQVIEVMIISIALGLLHMLIGYSIKVYNAVRKKEYASMYLDAIQWMLILLGAIVMAGNVGLGLESELLNNIGLVLILGNILGMFIVNMIDSGNPFIGFGKGLFGLIDLAGLVGDVVSYTRLTALAVSGANIGMAFNLIVGLFPPLVRFTIGILLFLALHALNIFITYLGAYVHSMRLEFVEFFGKFFDGGGKEFSPLRPIEKHVWIENELKK